MTLCCGLLAACEEDGQRAEQQVQTDAGNHGGHDNTQDAPDSGEDLRDVPCTEEYPTYSPGLETQAGTLRVRVVRADPEPPRQKVANDWTVEIVNLEGVPVPGAMLINPASYMEVHRHYGKTPPVVAVDPEPGRYKLNDIDFKMRGPWEVIFDVERAGEKSETARLKMCVE